MTTNSSFKRFTVEIKVLKTIRIIEPLAQSKDEALEIGHRVANKIKTPYEKFVACEGETVPMKIKKGKI